MKLRSTYRNRALIFQRGQFHVLRSEKTIIASIGFTSWAAAAEDTGFVVGQGEEKQTQKILNHRQRQLNMPYNFGKSRLRSPMCQFSNWPPSGHCGVSPSVVRQRWGGADKLTAQRPPQPLSCLKMTRCGSVKEVGVLSPAPSAVKNGIKMPKQSS